MRGLCLISFLFFSSNILAYERVEGVYEALVEISDRSDAEQNRAMREGLEQVLIRYTGYSAIASLPEIESELNSAQRYVIEFGLETSERIREDGLGIEESDSLWVRYNAGLIDELAATQELPIWPTLRPTLSYVLVNQLWGESHLPSSTDRPGLFLQMEKLFALRGLSAQPLAPLAAQSIGADAIWALSDSTFSQLKERSFTDVLAVIRLHEGAENRGAANKGADFYFSDAEGETLISRRADSISEALDFGINDYIDRLSLGLAFPGGAERELELYVFVENIREFWQYRRILDQIGGLEQVNAVRMENATDEGISYRIAYQSDTELLIETVEAVTGLRAQDEVESIYNLALPGSIQNPIRFRP